MKLSKNKRTLIYKVLIMGLFFNNVILASHFSNTKQQTVFHARPDQSNSFGQERVAIIDLVKMNNQQRQNLRELVVRLEELFFYSSDPKQCEYFNALLRTCPDATVVLECGDVMQIPSNCFANVNSIKKVRINAPCATSIGNDFLLGCESLTALDLRSLSNITSIGNNFLRGCESLTALDLRSLSALISIGNNFLYDCDSLTALDLRSLSALVSIGDNFLYDCDLTPETVSIPENWCFEDRLPSNLKPSNSDLNSNQPQKSVSLENFMSMRYQPIKNVHEVVVRLEESFSSSQNYHMILFLNKKLEENPNITVVLACDKATHIPDNCFMNLSAIRKIRINAPCATSIGNDFLRGCYNLTQIDLSSLSNITHIGNDFLLGCDNLAQIDLSSLSNITHIGNDFLRGCKGLKTLNLCSLSNLKSIGNRFLYDCVSLVALNISSLLDLTSIEDDFLYGCKGLTTLNLVFNLTSIGNGFLYGCHGLKTLDFSSFFNIKHIGNDFLRGCKGLTMIDFTSMPNLSCFGDNFLCGCSSLTRINLSCLSRVKKAGNGFLFACTRLTNITLSSSLSNLEEIKNVFLSFQGAEVTQFETKQAEVKIDLTPLSQQINDIIQKRKNRLK